MGLLTGHAVFPSVLAVFLKSCAGKDMSHYAPVFFTRDEYRLVTELADIILPATRTAAASAVNTQVFLDQVFHQCMTAEQQTHIREGLKELAPAFEKAPDKIQLIRELDESAYGKKEAHAWFRTLKQYILIGYFTSQEGTTRASSYVKFPDEYKGDIPADETTLNYGKTFLHY